MTTGEEEYVAFLLQELAESAIRVQQLNDKLKAALEAPTEMENDVD